VNADRTVGWWLLKTKRLRPDTAVGMPAAELHELLQRARAAGFRAGENAARSAVAR
jgi:hypothetical protein